MYGLGVASTPSIKVIKSFAFKGGSAKLWSNRYHFNGGTPSSDANWHSLMDAIVAAEKTIYGGTITIVECVGYAAGSDVPVSSKTYSTVGTWGSAGNYAPGEVAALIRYSTTARTTKNHPVYLFNYYHGMYTEVVGSDSDTLYPAQRSLMQTYAADWISGFTAGGITAVRAGPNGATAVGSLVEEYVTHRDFPYSTSA